MTDAERCRRHVGLSPRMFEDLLLDPLTEGDRSGFHRLMKRSPLMTWKREHATDDHLDELLAFRLRHYERFGFGPLAVRDSARGLIGQAGLQVLMDDGNTDNVEVVAFLAPDRWGTGLATRLLTWWLERAFHDAHLQAVWATVRPENQPAVALTERLGFRPAGHKQQYGFPSLLKKLDAVAFTRIERARVEP